jgi:hypothetical protein
MQLYTGQTFIEEYLDICIIIEAHHDNSVQ